MASVSEHENMMMRGDWAEGYGPRKGTWQYKVIKLPKDAEVVKGKLNEWSQYRWELIGILSGGFFTGLDTYFFKREGRA